MDLTKITHEVKLLAQEVGQFMKDERNRFSTESIEYKDVNNVVSYVDKEAEKRIVSKLKVLIPDAGFITEEGTVESEDVPLKWIIDPLDGTANYVHGLPHYSVSIALVNQAQPLLGVVFHVGTGELFWAIQGQGAFRNEQRIFVSNSKTLGKSLLATGFPYYKFEKQDKYLTILESLMQKTHGLRRFGSAAIDLAYVACGFFDGFFEYNLNSWDMAAGILLIQEAGGIVTDFEGGDDYLFGGNIVAGSAVQSELLNEIKAVWTR